MGLCLYIKMKVSYYFCVFYFLNCVNMCPNCRTKNLDLLLARWHLIRVKSSLCPLFVCLWHLYQYPTYFQSLLLFWCPVYLLTLVKIDFFTYSMFHRARILIFTCGTQVLKWIFKNSIENIVPPYPLKKWIILNNFVQFQRF